MYVASKCGDCEDPSDEHLLLYKTYICASGLGKADYGSRYAELVKGFDSSDLFVNICADEPISSTRDSQLGSELVHLSTRPRIPRGGATGFFSLVLREASLRPRARRSPSCGGHLPTLITGGIRVAHPILYQRLRRACSASNQVLPELPYQTPIRLCSIRAGSAETVLESIASLRAQPRPPYAPTHPYV